MYNKDKLDAVVGPPPAMCPEELYSLADFADKFAPVALAVAALSGFQALKALPERNITRSAVFVVGAFVSAAVFEGSMFLNAASERHQSLNNK
ncbi:MAG: hypothetical protein NTX11_00215 [Candidatus Saccharibacteria bacterium]|nr:hypothetical protein [Candidatus Saccharibacteria bacterium]